MPIYRTNDRGTAKKVAKKWANQGYRAVEIIIAKRGKYKFRVETKGRKKPGRRGSIWEEY